jgi:DNA-binding MarR family transcriptional regulator
MERYFKVTAPAVHQTVVTLEAKRFIERTPGVGRSIRLLVSRERLPDLE